MKPFNLLRSRVVLLSGMIALLFLTTCVPPETRAPQTKSQRAQPEYIAVKTRFAIDQRGNFFGTVLSLLGTDALAAAITVGCAVYGVDCSELAGDVEVLAQQIYTFVSGIGEKLQWNLPVTSWVHDLQSQF